jgi:hypothetical protein
MRVTRRWAVVWMPVMMCVAVGVHSSVGAAPAARAAGGAGSRPAAARNDLETVAPQRGRVPEEERDSGRGPRPHEPVFIEPAATTTEHTRLGLSAWIAPGAPFEHRENPGGVALGFTIAWPTPARAASSSAPRP